MVTYDYVLALRTSGHMYDNGKGMVKTNEAEALKYYRLSAKSGTYSFSYLLTSNVLALYISIHTSCC